MTYFRGLTVAVGLTQHTRAFQPYRNYAPLDRVTAGLIEQSFMWDLLDAVKTGVLEVKLTGQRVPIDGLGGTQDYVGINYYGRFYVKTDLFRPRVFEILPSDPALPDEPRNPSLLIDISVAAFLRNRADVERVTRRCANVCGPHASGNRRDRREHQGISSPRNCASGSSVR